MGVGNWRAQLGERHANIWVLLSDTDRFLSRARLMPRYERRMREWRQRLEEHRRDPEVIRSIRDELVALRRALRAEGWELRLGSMDVAVKGFRSDDSLARGFRRMVLVLGYEGAVYYAVGEANHITLGEELQGRLRTAQRPARASPHYLWYRVAGGLIELAGADSEPRENFEVLKGIVDDRKSDLVRALRKLT